MRTGELLALTAWTLDLHSELLYVGDAGATEANRASERRGVELGVYVTPREWLTLDADLAWSRGRFRQFDAAGSHIPGAVGGVASVGVALQHPGAWFGGARFHANDNDITYFYESRLPGEGAPVEDRHFHPVEPRTLRLTLEARY